MELPYLNKDAKYVVGVSGGCDSMALLDMMTQEGYQIIVAHVNYNLRHDTQEDYDVVSSYCDAHQIKFCYKEVHAEVEGNFQAYARDIRYDFYKELVEQYHCDGVVLGHHQDDLLETIYMQQQRGGIVDYMGIQTVTTIKNMVIIRPLLNYPKSDLYEYCASHQVAYHEDYTNFETHFTRDKVRNTILNTYTDQQKQALLDEATAYNVKQQKVLKRVDALMNDYHQNGCLNIDVFDDEIASALIYRMLKDVMSPLNISGALIKEVLKQLKSQAPNAEVSLPVNHLFIKQYHNVSVVKAVDAQDYAYTFTIWEDFSCPYFTLSSEGPMNNGIILKATDYPVTIRNIRPGDTIKTHGGTKKVSRLLIGAKVPRLERSTWPVLMNCDGEILLVPGIAKNKEYLATNPSCFVLK